MYLAHSNFKMVPLSSLAEINIGKTPARKEKLNFGKGTTWLSIRDLNGKKYIKSSKEELTEEGIKSSNIKIVQKGTLLFSFKLSIGKTAITQKDLYTNEAIAALPIKDESILDLNYFYYVMSSFDFTEGGDRAVMGQTLNKAKLAHLQIPLPPLKTQQEIAAILDEADKLRQLDKKLIKKYEALSQSLFLEMFGDPVSNPKGWDMVPMNNLCDFKRQSITPERISSEMKYIPLDAIQKGTGKILGFQSVEEGEIKSSKFYFTENHILYGKLRPYLNKVALPNFDGICSTDIIPILPKESNTNKYFISTIMRNNGFVSFADENSSGANLPRISPKEIEKFSTINPPFELQKIFGERIKQINNQLLIIQNSLKISEELFNSLLQKAFKGELV